MSGQSGTVLQPWWKRRPACYSQELRELRNAGYAPERDEAAFERGIVSLRVTVPTDAFGDLPLVVIYPDFYPHFRPQVAAPTLGFTDLPHHLHPFGRTLCLLGRGSEHWHASWTAARLIREQLEPALAAGRSGDVPEAGVEQAQAEPFHTYPEYPPAIVLVPPGLELEPEQRSGRFGVRLLEPLSLPIRSFARGVMTTIRDAAGKVLATADPLFAPPSGPLVHGRWRRLARPIVHPTGREFLKSLLQLDPHARSAPANAVDGGELRLWGVVYPDEVGHRCRGDAWMFVAEAAYRPPQPGPARTPKKPRNQKGRRR